MKKTRIIVPSILTMLMSCSLIAGATYSLFTSESTHDITVSSAKVNLVSAILTEGEDKIVTSSLGDVQENGNFANGGNVKFENNILALNNITPGDKVTFTIGIKNYSTVKVKYKITIRCKDGIELFDALNITVDPELEKDWSHLLPEENPSDPSLIKKVVTVELPSEADNDLQGMNTEIVVNVEAVQDNGDYNPTNPELNSTEDKLNVLRMNKVLSKKETKSVTMTEAVETLKENGIDFELIQPLTPNHYFLWNQDTDRFQIVDETDKVIYPADQSVVADYRSWKPVSSVEEVNEDSYSHYLLKQSNTVDAKVVNTSTGLDLGLNKGEYTINYKGDNDGRTIFQTNSNEAVLNVNSLSENGDVDHHGVLGQANIEKVGFNCYNEHGKTAVASIKVGKIIAEATSSIKAVIAETAQVALKKIGGVIEKAISKPEIIEDIKQSNIEHGGDVDFTGAEAETIEQTKKETIDNALVKDDAVQSLLITDLENPINKQKMDLKTFINSTNVDKKTYKNHKVELIYDIDLNGESIEPIELFEGHFDGKNKTISNFVQNDVFRSGLFKQVHGDAKSLEDLDLTYDNCRNNFDGNDFNKEIIDESKFSASVTNLNMKNIRISSDNGWGGNGIVCGYANNAMFDNIKVDDSILKCSKINGGLVGLLSDKILIKNCTIGSNVVLGSLRSLTDSIGGIAGKINANSYAAFINNTNDSQIKVNDFKSGLGGILAFGYAGKEEFAGNLLFVDNINNGTIECAKPGSGEHAIGGIYGMGYKYHQIHIRNVNNSNITFESDVTTTYSSAIGGIAGRTDTDKIVFYNCVNKGNIINNAPNFKHIFTGGLLGYCSLVDKVDAIQGNCVNDGTLTQNGVLIENSFFG